MNEYPPTNCKYCGAPGAHPGTQKCIGDGEACSLRCDLTEARELIAKAFEATGRAPGVDADLVEAVTQLRLSRDSHRDTAFRWSEKANALARELEALKRTNPEST